MAKAVKSKQPIGGIILTKLTITRTHHANFRRVKSRGDLKSTTKLKQHLSQGSDSYLFYKYVLIFRPPYL